MFVQGIDVSDLNGLLSRQNDGDNPDEEPLPKYGSADEFYELEEEIGKWVYFLLVW